jgi:hypothetical protein
VLPKLFVSHNYPVSREENRKRQIFSQKTNGSEKMKKIIAFLALVFLAVSLMQVNSVNAADLTVKEKSMAILSDVSEFDLDKYTISQKIYPNYSYYNVVPESNIIFTLTSDNSKLKVSLTYANENLHILNVAEIEGTPLTTKAYISPLDGAKAFLSNYQTLTGNSLYQELSLMLDDTDLSQNAVLTSGNFKLAVNTSAEETTFMWTYVSDGVEARHKCISMGFRDGLLRYFVDTWELYKIGSTTINLSQEGAVAIALEQARTFSWTVGSENNSIEVRDFNVTKAMEAQLIFANSLYADKARATDPLELFPMWRIGVGLDKFYPGNVYGIYVDIWADTKEIRHTQEAFSTLPPELVGSKLFEENQLTGSESQLNSFLGSNVSLLFLLLVVFMIAVSATSTIWLFNRRQSVGRSHKHRLHRIIATAICLLLFSTMLLAPILTANATTYRATIWGDRAFGYPTSKTATEQHLQDMIASNVSTFFNNGGYSASNYQGSSTTKTNILAQIEDSEESYDNAAVVYFDHGIGDWVDSDYDNWHYSVYDNNGDPVFDMDIYPETQDKTFFAFVNTCMSANMTYDQGLYGSGTACGLPFAFTHNLVGTDMSSDGYGDPWGDACYIGFPWGSASLSQQVDDVLYYNWVWTFFWYALTYNQVSVNWALDQASLMLYEQYFSSTDLRTGFTAIWGNSPPGYNCTMAVYGNGNLHLNARAELWIDALDNWELGAVDVWVDSQWIGNTNYNYLEILLSPGNHTVEVDPYAGSGTFSYFGTDYGDFYYNPINIYLPPDDTTYVVAYYFP